MTDDSRLRAHASLLERARPGRARLDGIVVPAARGADHLKCVLQLGADLGVEVVVLCSLEATVDHVLALADGIRGSCCAAIDVAAAPERLLPDFRTSYYAEACGGSRGDLSLKRNLGLVLGRMRGWRNLLFLDDDILGLRADQVTRAAGSLTFYEAVGMPADDFPDNSVVYHAQRLANDDQGVFVSGSALLVDLKRARSFFPETYNEDWLFLAPSLAAGKVAEADPVQQLPYDPFADPYRAKTEEFGDVLAEGFVGHLHRSRDKTPLEPYWERFLEQRGRRIADTAACFAGSVDPRDQQVRLALAEAEKVRSQLSAELFTEYLRDWDEDRAAWRAFLRTKARRWRSTRSAAADLGLTCQVNAECRERETVPVGGPDTGSSGADQRLQ